MCLLVRRLAVNVPLLLDASWLERVYRAVAWQCFDQICYNTISFGIYVPYVALTHSYVGRFHF
jgi:hypothetical protein